jgi:hypothetical protein
LIGPEVRRRRAVRIAAGDRVRAAAHAGGRIAWICTILPAAARVAPAATMRRARLPRRCATAIPPLTLPEDDHP